MTDQADDWGRVAAALEARMAELQLTIADVERDGGATFKTIQKALAGQPVVRRDALRKLAAGVKWTPNSIDRILRGEEPVTTETDAPGITELLEQNRAERAEVRSLIEELRAELRAEIEERRGQRPKQSGRP